MARRHLDLYGIRKIEERPKTVPVEAISPARNSDQQRFHESIPSRPQSDNSERSTETDPEQQKFNEAIPFAYPMNSTPTTAQTESTTDSARVTLFDVGLYASGLWLLAAPLVLHFQASRTFLISSAVVGVCLLIIAAGYTFRLIESNLFAFLSLVAGVVLLASPLIFSAGSDPALWNSIIMGYIVLGITLLTLLTTDSKETEEA